MDLRLRIVGGLEALTAFLKPALDQHCLPFLSDGSLVVCMLFNAPSQWHSIPSSVPSTQDFPTAPSTTPEESYIWSDVVETPHGRLHMQAYAARVIVSRYPQKT